MPSPNDPTVSNFLKFLDPQDPSYKDINWLMTNVFCAQHGSPPTRPAVGIAGGASGLGPQFAGTQHVRDLFAQLTTSFPNLHYARINNPPAPDCYSDDKDTIVIQALLETGPHRAQWFAGSHNAYSKPLSDIEPAGKATAVPTCAVFKFDPKTTGDNKIVRLGIYMDRWQMSIDLWAGTPHPKYAGRPFPHP
jgi:hypothetical protein